MSLHGIRDTSERLFGSRDRAAVARTRRLIDRGELAAIRLGDRRDRFVSDATIDALLAAAESTTATTDDR